jgi:hypothetical protein
MEFKKSKIIMIVGSLLLGALFYFPLWKITLVAPQYPEPLGLNIHINKLSDGVQFNDVNNIDLLNHYIGMHYLPSKDNVQKGVIEAFPEFTYMPIIVGLMIVLGIVFGFLGKKKLYATWLGCLAVLGILGIYDFYSWLQKYGSELDPNAILKMVDPETHELLAYNPPIFGFKQILNFEVYSYPAAGTYFILASVVLVFIAFIVSKKESKYGTDSSILIKKEKELIIA